MFFGRDIVKRSVPNRFSNRPKGPFPAGSGTPKALTDGHKGSDASRVCDLTFPARVTPQELHTFSATLTGIIQPIAHLEALMVANEQFFHHHPNDRMDCHHSLRLFELADIPSKERVESLLEQYHVLSLNSPSPSPAPATAMEAIQGLKRPHVDSRYAEPLLMDAGRQEVP